MPNNDVFSKAAGNSQLLAANYDRSGNVLPPVTAEDDDFDMYLLKNFESILDSIPKDQPEYSGLLSYFSILKYDEYKHTRGMEYLQDAIRRAEEAVAATPIDHSDLPVYLNNLGCMLESRFERIGRIEDLEKAIRRAEEAVAATPIDHPDLPGRLNNLGNKLQSRFERIGRMEDLEEAIRRAEEAVAATPIDHPNLLGRLNNLGNKLYKRFERSERIEDLEDAIRRAEEAAAATPIDHSDLPAYLNNLGCMLESRFKRTRRMEDLEEAIRRAEEAVAATPIDHPNLPAYLSNLGNKLQSRFERTGRIEDLEEVIRRAEEAVAATPIDHPDLAFMLNSLGSKLQRRFERTAGTKDSAYALQLFLKAWGIISAIPFHRLKAALAAVIILKNQREWSVASRLAEEALKLLPVLNNRSLRRQDQQHVVSQFSGLVVDACSLLLMQGNNVDAVAEQAVQILELGRGAISNLLIDDRSDISGLKAGFPEMAANFGRVQVRLNEPALEVETLRTDSGALRLALVQQLDRCIDDIRRLPGQSQFLQPPSSYELRKIAEDGIVVVVNVSDLRADAIVVTSSSIKAFELPQFQSVDIQTWLEKRLSEFNLSDRGAKNREYLKFPAWLWESCVQPIFQYLGFSPHPMENELPRV